jgi:hypothetical protein
MGVKIKTEGVRHYDASWIHLAQDGIQWRAAANAVMNF